MSEKLPRQYRLEVNHARVSCPDTRSADQDEPPLVEVWKDLNQELRHRDTMYMQLFVCTLLFLGAFGALLIHFRELKLLIWLVSGAALIVVWVYSRMVMKGREKCYEATREVERSMKLPQCVLCKLKAATGEKKPRLSVGPGQLLYWVPLVVLWIGLGHLVVFAS